jgi:putative spermidine/putrescine transport system substrate-binding protein
MARSSESISRRRFIATSIGGGVGVVASPAIWSPARAASQTLYVNTWGGSWTAAEDVAFYKPFASATGIGVRTVTPVSYAKLKAQVQSGNFEWDVTTIEQGEMLRAEREGLLEPINWSIVDKDKLFPNAVYGSGIGVCALTTNLVYRADKFGQGAPKSWADFWDVNRFPGPRAMYNHPIRAMVFALVADGVPVERVYPIDMDRAFRKLDQIKPHIKVWWTQASQSQQILRDGEAVAMAMYNARASELKTQGVPVEIVWDGATLDQVYWCVARGAPNRDLAWRFIEFTTAAERQAVLCSRLFYGPANPAALEHMPLEIAKQLPTYPENMRLTVRSDPEWFAANAEKANERFLQWLAS